MRLTHTDNQKMTRLPFYKVDKVAWLFTPANPGPEEEVRQWCLHELLRCYGVEIGNIVTEWPVKVGRSPHRADIVIFTAPDKPYCVIECKEPGHKKHEVAINQAISYARAGNGKAQFAIYTNGDEWLVRRRIGEDWLPVNDLPHFHQIKINGGFEELAVSCSQLLPLLYWLDRPVPAKFAAVYFEALHEVFVSTNIVPLGTDSNLDHVLEALLRILPEITNAEGYISEKMGVVYRTLKDYSDAHGAPMMPYKPGTPAEIAHDCIRVLTLYLENSKDRQSMDLAALRLLENLLRYYCGVSHKLKYRDIEVDVQHSLREYLDLGLKLNLNSSLPDRADINGMKSLRSRAEPVWNRLKKKAWF